MNVFNKSLSQENEAPKVSEEALDAMYEIGDLVIEASRDPDNHPAYDRMRKMLAEQDILLKKMNQEQVKEG